MEGGQLHSLYIARGCVGAWSSWIISSERYVKFVINHFPIFSVFVTGVVICAWFTKNVWNASIWCTFIQDSKLSWGVIFACKLAADVLNGNRMYCGCLEVPCKLVYYY